MESKNENRIIAGEREGSTCEWCRGNHPLVISPVTIRTARAFLAWTQRHPALPTGAAFAIGVRTGDGTLIGVALIGWPTASVLDDGDTAEIFRLATDGCASDVTLALLGAAWSAVRQMGYRRLITYTYVHQLRVALWEAGFRIVSRPFGWDTVSCTAPVGADDVARVLWEIRAAGGRP